MTAFAQFLPSIGFCQHDSSRPPGSLRHAGKNRCITQINCCDQKKIIDFDDHSGCDHVTMRWVKIELSKWVNFRLSFTT